MKHNINGEHYIKSTYARCCCCGVSLPKGERVVNFTMDQHPGKRLNICTDCCYDIHEASK